MGKALLWCVKSYAKERFCHGYKPFQDSEDIFLQCHLSTRSRVNWCSWKRRFKYDQAVPMLRLLTLTLTENQVLLKWLEAVLIIPAESRLGNQLMALEPDVDNAGKHLQIVADTRRKKSTRTLNVRVSSLLLYIRWHRDSFGDQPFLPFLEENIYCLRDKACSASRGKQPLFPPSDPWSRFLAWQECKNAVSPQGYLALHCPCIFARDRLSKHHHCIRSC